MFIILYSNIRPLLFPIFIIPMLYYPFPLLSLSFVILILYRPYPLSPLSFIILILYPPQIHPHLHFHLHHLYHSHPHPHRHLPHLLMPVIFVVINIKQAGGARRGGNRTPDLFPRYFLESPGAEQRSAHQAKFSGWDNSSQGLPNVPKKIPESGQTKMPPNFSAK